MADSSKTDDYLIPTINHSSNLHENINNILDEDNVTPDTSSVNNKNPPTDNEKLIIVTGFGPFIGHELVNASWEAVRILPSTFKLNDIQYTIQTRLVCVEYEKVDEAVDEIWKENPMLVVHCGVHAGAKSIQLESLAYNNKFSRRDYARKRLRSATVCLDRNGSCCERICTKLNLNEIVHELNVQGERPNTLIVSNDVGNYLCGYIYLKSLDVNCDRSLFIHVPPIGKPFTSSETSSTIFQVIQKCVEQIEFQQEDDTFEDCIGYA